MADSNTGFNDIVKGADNIGRSKETMIGRLDTLLSKYNKDNIGFSPELLSILTRLARKRKEFDATRFFVLVVGPVKSGKSTLVNIFARRYVSPTAYKECTALPTIIGKSTGEHLDRIVQYLPTEKYCSDEDKIETFDYIVDVIRNVEEHDVLDGRVNKVVSDLNNENIKKIITLFHDDDREKNELVVSVGIKGGGFIDDDIMLIDMPGLDGSKKNKDNTLVYSSMAERADVVFFVQSTTTAINKASIEFLNKLFHNKKGKVPVWLIHNVHDSQYFLTDDDKKQADVNEQIALGRERVKNGFGIEMFEDKILNLGKIYAAINEKERVKHECEGMIDEAYAEYVKVEKEIIDKLKSERQKIKDTINVGKAADTVNDAIAVVERIIGEKNSEKEILCKKVRRIKELPAKTDAIQFVDALFMNELDNLFVKEEIAELWKTSIETIVDRFRPVGSAKIKGSDLKVKIDRITQECSDVIPVGSDTQFRSLLCSALSNYIQSTCSLVTEDVKETAMEVAGEQVTFALDVDTSVLSMKVTAMQPFYSDISERHEFFGVELWSKKYDYSEQNDYLNIVRDYLKSKVEPKLQEYKKILKNDFKTVCNATLVKLKNSIVEYSEDYDVRQKKNIERLECEISLMNEMLNDLRN
ncbi:MAG: dynamin family protein [Bacteroidaceae bacterium]|nr:dynamin family protein [Bacteroidaceae bacterium]